MKQLLSVLLIASFVSGFGQEDTKKPSFLAKNQPIELFSNMKTLDTKRSFNLKLPTDFSSTQSYLSDVMNFMPNDSRWLNYSSADLSDANNAIFGTFMNTSVDLGNTRLNTQYFFDYAGGSTTVHFTFGKKKK